MGQEILLEAGTNEMEMLVFRLGATPFGINVAKVREIVQRAEIIHIPYAPKGVEGSFRLREQVLTLVNLGAYFDMQGEQTLNGEGMFIIVEFNGMQCGVLVDEVARIHRLSWDQIQPPSEYLIEMAVPVTGIVDIEGELVLVADFEAIVGEILGLESARMLESTGEQVVGREDVRIIVADDSSVLRLMLTKILKGHGFTNLTVCTDGQQAWEIMEAHKNDAGGPCDLLLTDIEMPQMDGLHLTAKVKSDPALKDIPVVLFSSLISEDNRRKGQSVGADAQVSKPDSEKLIGVIEECLAKRDISVKEVAGKRRVVAV